MVVLALKILLMAVIGGLVSLFVFGGDFWYGFIVMGIITAIYVFRNRKTLASRSLRLKKNRTAITSARL